MLLKQKASALLHSLLKEKSVPVMTGPLRGWQWLPRSGNHAYWLGRHEREYIDAFAQCIEPGDIVFDIGAQAGYFTLVASRLADDSGKVVSFEPFPRNIKFVKEHLQLNGCENVTLLEVAVGGSKGERTFEAANVFMGHLSDSSALDAGAEKGDESLTVQVVTLDELWAQDKALAPDVMKIDTEGMEYWVLQGGRALIQQKRPVLFVATHGEKNSKENATAITRMELRS